MKAKDEKTNVMRVLDSKRIKYQHYYYGDTDAIKVGILGRCDSIRTTIRSAYLKH